MALLGRRLRRKGLFGTTISSVPRTTSRAPSTCSRTCSTNKAAPSTDTERRTGPSAQITSPASVWQWVRGEGGACRRRFRPPLRCVSGSRSVAAGLPDRVLSLIFTHANACADAAAAAATAVVRRLCPCRSPLPAPCLAPIAGTVSATPLPAASVIPIPRPCPKPVSDTGKGALHVHSA